MTDFSNKATKIDNPCRRNACISNHLRDFFLCYLPPQNRPVFALAPTSHPFTTRLKPVLYYSSAERTFQGGSAMLLDLEMPGFYVVVGKVA